METGGGDAARPCPDFCGPLGGQWLWVLPSVPGAGRPGSLSIPWALQPTPSLTWLGARACTFLCCGGC